MNIIKFNNNKNHFKALTNKAKELSSDEDGLTKEDINTLKEFAKNNNDKDGFQGISSKESVFISSINNHEIKENSDNSKVISNINFIKSADFDPNSFSLKKVKNKEVTRQDNKSYSYDISGEPETINNPMNSKIIDIGVSVFNKTMSDTSITGKSLFSKAKESITNDPELISTMSNFAKNMDYDKETMMYISTLITREPPLTNSQIKGVLDKVNSMLNKTFDYRVGNVKDLVTSSLHDISAPSNIDQKDIGTCSGTSIQMQLAVRKPVKYLEMIDSLSQNKSFGEISPNWTFVDDKTNRSISSRIMQNAIMDYADSDDRNFNSLYDEGLSSDQAIRVYKELFQEDDFNIYNKSSYTQNQLVDVILESDVSYKNPIQISMAFAKSGRDSFHAVNVIGIDKDKNKVSIINPWGRKETFSLDKLKSKIMGVIADKSTDKKIETQDSKKLSLLKNIPNNDLANKIIEKPNLLNSIGRKSKMSLILKLKNSSELSPKIKQSILILLDSYLDNEQTNKSLMNELADSYNKSKESNPLVGKKNNFSDFLLNLYDKGSEPKFIKDNFKYLDDKSQAYFLQKDNFFNEMAFGNLKALNINVFSNLNNDQILKIANFIIEEGDIGSIDVTSHKFIIDIVKEKVKDLESDIESYMNQGPENGPIENKSLDNYKRFISLSNRYIERYSD